MLLKLYSESKTTHIMRKKALQRGQPQGPVSIAQPHLSMFGTATPKFFYQSLTERTMENGLLARCLVLEAGPRGAAGDPHEEEFPEMVLETVAELVRLGRERNLEGVYPHPVVLLETPEATERLKEVRLLADAEYEKAGGRGQDAARALWARAGEKVSKLAALHAVSANPKAPEMDAASVDWAWRFVSHSTRRMLYMAGMFVSETDFDVLAKKVVRAVEAKGRISHARLLRNMHVKRDVFRQAVDTLVESGTLRREAGAKGGRLLCAGLTSCGGSQPSRLSRSFC